MKHIYILFLLVSSIGFAQIPSNYYDSANGLSGFTLKTQLKSIISNGHTARTYDQLYDGSGVSGSNGYVDTHSDIDVTGGTNYENDGTVLDFYSENPTGADPYNFTHNVDEGGNQNSEGDCYNREHIVPQSSFNSNYPMQSDIHHVIPTDCRVNNYRGSYPFGNVGSVNLTSENGSKRGTSAMAGYSGIVFEPIDEFKGDIARALLYFATRYESTVDGYTSFDMFNGTEDQVFFPWAIEVLLDWHNNVDPVDQRERERNKAAFNFQGNANPFVDHPEYADLIWNPTPDTEAPTNPTNLAASNPTDNSIALSWTASSDNIGVVTYDIYIDGSYAFNSSNTTATATGLTASTNYCFTVKAKDAANNESGFSNQDCETTTNNGTIGGSDCLTETFSNLDTSIGSYTDVSWTGDEGGTWSATEARTDQVINTSTTAAITIRDGVLTLPTTSGGIGALTVTTKRVFSGSDGTFNVNVNGTFVGTIAYSATEQTITLPNINIENSVSIVIDGNSGITNRVVFDDLSYTCYSALNVEDFNVASVKIHPNPVKNTLTVDLKSDVSTSIEIFDILGKRVLNETISKTSNLNVQNLKSGIYIVKVTQDNSTVTKKLIKQ
ncbi:endonuclease [Winogradskyella thalassocola]|uniref:Por secretion system C-terminal sorting domain-containing protein n=1 Tax=Winogradskyella thalassocola TaxID=262004 RepID=A0A1G8AXF9_9FLAO|nr:endonuclease [Winogradskyella thalassocola]SDH25567.1 Por secretion system C-terminal sorting domain-containing protein [Winogradskyella thalassocola]